jgi:hypothetical protein
MPPSLSRCGERKVGSILTIRAVGSNGIAVIIPAGAIPTIFARSSAGAPFGDTLRN